jgi:crossover junction endodeoxyribonuclease RusA
VIRLRVNGIPAPQGSKRHVGNGRMVEMSKAVGPWREAVRAEAQRKLSMSAARTRYMPGGEGVAVFVTIVFVLPRPKGHYGTGRNAGIVKDSAPWRPATKPDVDKLARAVLDALTGTLLGDDAQVADLVASKVYASAEQPPGAIIELGPCEGKHWPKRED